MPYVITYRLVKGSPINGAEYDGSLHNLDGRVTALEDALPSAGVSVDNFALSGNQFSWHLSNGDVLGPYTFPELSENPRGPWSDIALGDALAKNDIVRYGTTNYIVLWPHAREATFDPAANDGLGHNYYTVWIEDPANALPDDGIAYDILQKVDGTAFNVRWAPAGFKPGGTIRQFPIKNSSTNYDWDWGAFAELLVTLDDLADVAFPSSGPADGDALIFSASSGKFELQPAIGEQTLWIDASSMIPQQTNGPDAGRFETATNHNMVDTLDFDHATQQFAQRYVTLPNSWDGGLLKFVPQVTHGATSTDFGIVFGLDAVAIPSGSSLDAAFGTAQTSALTGGVTNGVYTGPQSSAITIAGTPAPGNLVLLRIHRDPADAADTLGVDARLLGFSLIYKTRQMTDDA